MSENVGAQQIYPNAPTKPDLNPVVAKKVNVRGYVYKYLKIKSICDDMDVIALTINPHSSFNTFENL